MKNKNKQKKHLTVGVGPCDNTSMKTTKIKPQKTDKIDAFALAYFMHGNPRPKERPRFNRYGGARNTEKTKSEELLQSMHSRTHAPAGGPLPGAIQVVLNYYIKPSKNKKTTEAHTGTPDTDNLAKLTLDAITKAVKFWHDDGQVNALLITKQYSDEPGVGVAIIYNNLTRPDISAGDFIARAINSPATQGPAKK